MLTSPLQRLVAGLAALQLTQAAPSVLEARTITENLATFEDIPTKDLGASVQVIGNYKDVYWRGMRLVSKDGSGITEPLGLSPPNSITAPGVIPHSPPKCAGFSFVGQTEDGMVSMTTIYDGSPPNKLITLHSFWWGAELRTQQTVVTVPQNAQLIVIGYNQANEAVAVRNYDYDFTGLSQQMVFADADSSFQLVSYVEFAVQSVAAGLVVAILLDSLNYTVTT